MIRNPREGARSLQDVRPLVGRVEKELIGRRKAGGKDDRVAGNVQLGAADRLPSGVNARYGSSLHPGVTPGCFEGMQGEKRHAPFPEGLDRCKRFVDTHPGVSHCLDFHPSLHKLGGNGQTKVVRADHHSRLSRSHSPEVEEPLRASGQKHSRPVPIVGH